jgi:hypothetical protein
MKRGKKAQFYIIGAVIIIMAMISLASVSNYVLVKKEPAKFMDLGSMLNLEGEKVFNFNLYNGPTFSSGDTNSVIENFSQMMAKYIEITNENVDLIIIHGNSSNAQITIISRNSTGTITLNMGAMSSGVISEEYIPKTFPVYGNYINITLLNNTYVFELGDDEEFMFVMTKSEGFEQYVYNQ